MKVCPRQLRVWGLGYELKWRGSVKEGLPREGINLRVATACTDASSYFQLLCNLSISKNRR